MAPLPTSSLGNLQPLIAAVQQITVQLGNLISRLNTYLPLTGGSVSGPTTFTGPVTFTEAIVADGYACKPGTGSAPTGNDFNIGWTGTPQLWIDTTDVGTLAYVSDYRIKADVAPLPSMWDAVKALNPISYTEQNFGVFTAKPGERWGYIAHELQDALIPNAATGVKDQPDLLQSPNPWPVLAALTKALQEAQARIEGLAAPPPPERAHYVRVITANNALNAAIADGAVLHFDTIQEDTDGYAPVVAAVTPTAPSFNLLAIPPGLGGVYLINGWASGSGNQSTTLGMGVLVNGVRLTGTNQSIHGPGSVNYTLDNAAVAVLRLHDGDTVQLFNTSVSGKPNPFTAVFLSLARFGA